MPTKLLKERFTQIPDIDKIRQLQENGYSILINENDKVPPEIRSIPGIRLVYLITD